MFKHLYELSTNEKIRILGLMSGTSADGLDMVNVEFSGFGKYPDYKVLEKRFVSYPAVFSRSFKDPLKLSASRISELHFELGKWYGTAIAGMQTEFDVCANHGQTLLHQPPAYTLQIGEAQCIANACRKPTIYDFRTADVMLGGQGAPLIPVLDEFLLRDESAYVIALNMGGIANLTLLPPRSYHDPIYAWDTGPANTLIDKAVIDFTSGKKAYDEDGKYAQSGRVDEQLMDIMLSNEYVKRDFPKSAGQEEFGHEYYQFLKEKVNPNSTESWLTFIASLSEFTVLSIVNDIKRSIKNVDHKVKIIVSGGGANNPYIMKRLNEELKDCEIRTFALPGISSDMKEAFGFAYLGYLFLRRLPGNIPTVTGASRPAILGKIAF